MHKNICFPSESGFPAAAAPSDACGTVGERAASCASSALVERIRSLGCPIQSANVADERLGAGIVGGQTGIVGAQE